MNLVSIEVEAMVGEYQVGDRQEIGISGDVVDMEVVATQRAEDGYMSVVFAPYVYVD